MARIGGDGVSRRQPHSHLFPRGGGGRTNNAAERALRPAVVMRKISGGHRSEKGARAWAVLASVMRTMQQQGLPLVESIQTLLRGAWAGQDVVLLTELFDTS